MGLFLFVLWFVGWLFTVGLADPGKQDWQEQVLDMIMWPLLLGVTIREFILKE